MYAKMCRDHVQHLPHRLVVSLVLRDARKHLHGRLERPDGEDVGDGVAALVRRTEDGVRRARHALGVGNGGVTLETVEEDVEARGDVQFYGRFVNTGVAYCKGKTHLASTCAC